FLCVIAWGVWSSARGIREAKRTRERLAQGEHALRVVAENASELVCIVGADAALSYVSPSCERVLGYTPVELRGVPLERLFPDEERDVARRLTRLAPGDSGSTEPVIHRLRDKSGGYRWFETHAC